MAVCFILAIYVFLILVFQCNYSNGYNVESDDMPYEYVYHVNTTTNSIEECEFCDASICKGSYCFKADEEFRLPFIEIPINANTSVPTNLSKQRKSAVNRYITYPYDSLHDPNMIISFECTKDSQCFTNKCVDNHCKFNENEDVKLCVYGHCGRFMGAPCTSSDECAFGDCKQVCARHEEPEGETDIEHGLKFFSMLGFMIILVVIACCIACHNSDTKANRAESYKQFTSIN